MSCPIGISHPDRIVQLIARDRLGRDVIVLDVLGSDHQGVQGITLLEGWEGLPGHAPRTQIRKKWAHQEGADLSPFPRVEERTGSITLGTAGRDVASWERIESLLWRVLRFDTDAWLRSYDAQGGWREIPVRLMEPGPKPEDTSLWPGVKPYAAWKVPLLAVDPWWRSPDVTDTLTRADMIDDGAGGWIGQLTVPNPCDTRGWVQWASGTITAPETWTLPDPGVVYDAATAPTPAQVGDPVTHTLPTLGPGKEFLVDTHPTAPTLLVRDGAQDWARMRGEAFEGCLEPGSEPVTLTVKLTGGTPDSQIKVYVPQRWDRSFGGELW